MKDSRCTIPDEQPGNVAGNLLELDKQELGHGGGSRSDEVGWTKTKFREGGQEDQERRSGDLASVRGPTGRWNPRSRLIAIKAPLRLRL
ncbi:hypothetical protein ALC53_08192 [Atta colombica]|uniref:Uncharacterized protein n=1 Tax=Atta colombica TaxID=520822 RepID=A0A195BB56_9HYME|nr:hypothetical protein ALC53_08192 [Atta colombica]